METMLTGQVEKGKIKEAQKALYRKLVEDQRAVEKYFHGEYTLQQLHAKGIKFFKPI